MLQTFRKTILSALFFLNGATVCLAANDKPFTVPEMTEWQGAEGFMTPSGKVVVASSSLKAVAEQFCRDYRLLTRRTLEIADRKTPRKGDIVVRLRKEKALGEEGYRMAVGQWCEVSASTVKAVYWGTQTLLQLSEQQASLPCGTAIDVPQYRVRGFMLDVGRKYIPMDYLHQLVRVMSYYKMNLLQLHLNDNSFKQYFDNDWMKTPCAFRLECDTYPGLTAKDGSYSKQEFRQLTAAAAQCGIDLVPEIDAPAHALAFTKYNSALASKEYGMDHFDIFNPEVYTFMDNLFKEYLDGKDPVFCGKYVHIGTDEYANATQELKEKFRAYTDHYLALVERYGKHPMLWGALSHADGKTPVRQKGVTMTLWSNDMADPIEMKRQGWQFISIPDWQVYLVPLADYYHDYLPTASLYNTWTPRILRSVELKERDPQVEGGMFALWNDLYGNGITVADLHDRIYPVLQVMADKCWTAQLVQLPFAAFEQSCRTLSEAPGINVRGKMGVPALTLEEVKAGERLGLPVAEVGFGHRISFTVDCAAEAKGTALTVGPQSTFYLSDPVSGKLGYLHEDYLDTFDYTLPTEGEVEIAIETTNRETTLYVDGVKRETLGEQRFYVCDSLSLVNKMPFQAERPAVHHPSVSMRYLRTLFFPLQEAGRFKSRVSRLRMETLEAATGFADDRHILATAPEVSFTGRVQRLDNGGVRYDWTGVYLQTAFTGSRIAAVMSEEGTSFHNVFIDGQWVKKIKVTGKEPQTITLADRLSEGQHILRLQKCTEGEYGCTTVKEIVVERTAELSPVLPADRFIEVIGDSYTCGYGTESDNRDDPFQLETENCDKAYACIVARHFNADYALVAHSGQGIVRHWGDSVQISADNMPIRWTQRFDAHGTEPYDYQAYRPQLVLINVGTNDFSPGAMPTVEQYVGSYVKLIQSVKARYGEEVTVLCITPHSANSELKAALHELRNRTQQMHRVYMANAMDRTVSEDTDLGASWHPNYRGQCKIAMSLIPQISTIMGWPVTTNPVTTNFSQTIF